MWARKARAQCPRRSWRRCFTCARRKQARSTGQGCLCTDTISAGPIDRRFSFMPTLAIFLLLIGAALHTIWNLIIKQADDKFIVTWWVVVIGGIASLIALPFTGLPPRTLWGFVFFSVLVEGVYFLALSYAYRDHDFSLIYPIARGA